MSARKAFVRRTLFAAGLFGGATTNAFAFDYTSGGSLNGISNVSGTMIINGAGGSIPCNATFTTSISGGSASITAASFSGSAICAYSTPCNLPWAMGFPTGTLGTPNNAVLPMCMHFPSPISETCNGTITGTLSSTGLTFTGSVAASPEPIPCFLRSLKPFSSTPILSIM